MPNVTNDEFLSAIFGAEEKQWVHVTAFASDPALLEGGDSLRAWMGNYYSLYRFPSIANNQYFTISQFYADNEQRARRRKSLFRHTNCIVLDDVREKLKIEEVEKLPLPSWVLETSQGSEQWGYILDKPCTERARVENLLDGLVSEGLAPDGKDPGMKGVTRYVRLPEGYNTKKKRFINNQPYKCRMLQWSPGNKVSLEQLALPFNIDLNRVRREARLDGASDIPDHPLLGLEDMINIKDVRSDGRYDITCPWVEEHTGQDDSGTAIFTNSDGTIGFKCHHGSCQHRTGRHLLEHIEKSHPLFSQELKQWQVRHAFKQVQQDIKPPLTFLSIDQLAPPPVQDAPPPPAPNQVASNVPDPVQAFFNALRSTHPSSEAAIKVASELLKLVDTYPPMERINYHKELCDLMGWTKPEFKVILDDLRGKWYENTNDDRSFFSDVVYVAEQNQFYNMTKRIFYTPDAYSNAYSHFDAEARKKALQDGFVTKVDKIDYAPKMPQVFEEGGIKYANAWVESNASQGIPGDVVRWLDHFDVIGWSEHKKHILQWFAYTIRHPDEKINHMIIFGGKQGSGKDFLLYPLIEAMGDNSKTIEGDDLISDYDDYKLCVKHLHINEVEIGNRQQSKSISAKLKPLCAEPPKRLRVNPKGVRQLSVRNILNATMSTNSNVPLIFDDGPGRRTLALWTNLDVYDERDEMTPEWREYWIDRWGWMKRGGAEACIYYLRNAVDLSDFEPKLPPPITDYLRDIADSSKSQLRQTIEAFINLELHNFERDILTVEDVIQTLKNGAVISPDSMYVDPRRLTPSSVKNTMRQIRSVAEVTINISKYKKRNCVACAWIIRKGRLYETMTNEQLATEYVRQVDAYENGRPLGVARTPVGDKVS